VSRIPPVDLKDVDPGTRDRIEQAQIRGIPLPDVERIMAHAPAVIESFDSYLASVVAAGSGEPQLKELLRMHVARSLGADEVLGPSADDPRLAVLDTNPAEGGFTEREQAALAYADAIL
jgi:hypothetical protein